MLPFEQLPVLGLKLWREKQLKKGYQCFVYIEDKYDYLQNRIEINN